MKFCTAIAFLVASTAVAHIAAFAPKNFITRSQAGCIDIKARSDTSGNSNAIEDEELSEGSDCKEEEFNAESDGMEIPLDEDHLSWLTTPDVTALAGGETAAERNVEAKKIEVDEDENAVIAELVELDVEDGDEESIYVGDTYLLGEQIASALEKAEIGVEGVDDEEAIAPALADALLSSIERDAYHRNNEGWNQFGAESLYSIGEDDMDVLEDEYSADDDAFTDEFLRHLSAATASVLNGDDSGSLHPDGEEIALVADSILNIINRDEDDVGMNEETYDEPPIASTNNAETDGGGKNNEPPTSHRYVLKADGFP
jgi:hypothetical protein